MDVREMENSVDQLRTAVTDYDQAKKMLCVEVIGTEQNAEMLKKVPHTDMEDLAMIYQIQLSHCEDGFTSAKVTNLLMESWGVTPEQLHADAMENAPQIRPPVFKNLLEFIGTPDELMEADEIPQMYVLTNEYKLKGAAAVFYLEAMENVAKELGGSFFVLPSSVHEVLILPDDGFMKVDELRNMVTEINATQLTPEERLTDSVYHFDAESRTFELGEKYEQRMEAREHGKADRASVLRDLQDKCSNMDLTPKPATHRFNAEPVM